MVLLFILLIVLFSILFVRSLSKYHPKNLYPFLLGVISRDKVLSDLVYIDSTISPPFVLKEIEYLILL